MLKVMSGGGRVLRRGFSVYDAWKGRKNPALSDSSFKVQGVTIVRDKESARRVLEVLSTLREREHAWDTETVDLEVKERSPVGNGRVVSAQLYCGPDAPFEDGPRVFIDNFADASGVLAEFREYFADRRFKKVWFNYGFDRHVLFNEGIDAQGFAGDVMQMARLLDGSRDPKAYSLNRISLFYTNQLQIEKGVFLEEFRRSQNSPQSERNMKHFLENDDPERVKISMAKLFARRKRLKNGEEGKIMEVPSVEELHTSPLLRDKWISYATFDAEVTFFLFRTLRRLMLKLPVGVEDMKSTWELYQKYWMPFGELLTDIERRGIRVNRPHLEAAQAKARADVARFRATFLGIIHELQPEAVEFNPSSVAQLQTLFFAPFERKKPQSKAGAQATELPEDLGDGDAALAQPEEAADEDDDPLKVRRNFKVIDKFETVRMFKVEKLAGHDYGEEPKFKANGEQKVAKKYREMPVRGYGIPATSLSASGLPSVENEALKGLLEKGLAQHFQSIGQPELGEKLKIAVQALIDMRQTETLLHTFIESLLEAIDDGGRVHCSLNINTETGRLSARKPNLQNQPALDKDVYQTRRAFEASPGCKLIIADYGQLELRVLAAMTNCRSMIEAFKAGGDFHSRTAAGMFPEIAKELAEGRLLLEKSAQATGLPLLKEKYANERKKAKTMNFSVAYGKSAYGFSKDWNCSMEEAQKFLDLWYADRPEVHQWQEKMKRCAVQNGYVKTLHGRYRNLTKFFVSGEKLKILHGLRAAINTPIQGGAADVVIAAMVKIHRNARLQELGWFLIHQVHDEVILEGPEATAAEAMAIVKALMESPVDLALPLKLEVDAKVCSNWFEKN